jgi:aminopeptidase N
MPRSAPLALAVLVACGGTSAAPDAAPDATVVPATANLDREVVATALSFDVGALTAVATITLGPSAAVGATLEIGDLDITSAKVDGVDVPFADRGATLDLGLPAGAAVTVAIAYHFKHHDMSDGAATTGFTLLWPYYCGNLFPCHASPTDGTTFTVDVHGVPAGKTAIYPPTIPSEAPAYQVAFAIDDYTQLDLGKTTAGTLVSAWYRHGELLKAQAGTAELVTAFDWLERTLGPYRFGDHVGTVSVYWGPSAFGGMEHHPRWHVSNLALADEETNIHEASHGWFGDGIRLRCWEDFVLSEGTVSYLAGHILDLKNPALGTKVWKAYAAQLAAIAGTDPVWPTTCGVVDVLKDHLFSAAPYMRGAFFYRAVALKVGADQLDLALAAFYQQYAGKVASMGDMLTTIKTVTGYDPASCADGWLRSATIPAIGPCP